MKIGKIKIEEICGEEVRNVSNEKHNFYSVDYFSNINQIITEIQSQVTCYFILAEDFENHEEDVDNFIQIINQLKELNHNLFIVSDPEDNLEDENEIEESNENQEKDEN